MDLLKIFRMQEPVPKDLLTKNNEIGKYKEVIQEKDVLLRNSKAQVRDLEQQIFELENKNRQLEGQVNAKEGENIIKEYDAFFSKVMSESQEIIKEKDSLKSKFAEMESFSLDLLLKYEKSKEALTQYEEMQEKLKDTILEYEEIINYLTVEYNRLKTNSPSKLDDDSKGDPQQKGRIKEFLTKQHNDLQKHLLEEHCSKSMFEPLKGLDK